ncbi:MAG: 2-nitropropane dioxygenase [Alphaproteobacteria bacterium 43-37]|nr:MAG: 2-nitropropane dioxygenase [Alphaproteobacteria bacterium 43-37]
MMSNSAQVKLEKLWQRGRSFLGVEYAILGGAMTWVSESNLVAALSNAGCFGILASGSTNPSSLKEEIQKTRSKTSKPFGVNIITMHPQFDEQMQVCTQENVEHIILAGGLPRSEAIQYLKANGHKVICFAPALSIAKKLIRSGVDALIIEGMEAGGHIGPVSTSVLAQEILPNVTDVPVFVAGGIGRGDAIVSYLEMGASGGQLGTRFVCSQESIAHQNFKKAFINASARDAVPSVQLDPRFPVIPVRAISNKATNDFLEFQAQVIDQFKRNELTQKEAQLQIEHFWGGALRRAVVDGDVENGSLMAGQSVGMVSAEQSIQDIIFELLAQAYEAISKRSTLLNN